MYLLLIMSDVFGEKIKENIIMELPSETIIYTWRDVFEAEVLE
jgi:hypothetical protein